MRRDTTIGFFAFVGLWVLSALATVTLGYLLWLVFRVLYWSIT